MQAMIADAAWQTHHAAWQRKTGSNYSRRQPRLWQMAIAVITVSGGAPKVARMSLSWGRRKGLVSSSSCRVLGIVALPCSHFQQILSAQMISTDDQPDHGHVAPGPSQS